MSDHKLPKLIVLLGPTASGKTEWSLRLAKKYNGEIVSADSRQLYTKMSIGTAKPPGHWRWQGIHRAYVVDGIPHHMVDFLDPGKRFNVAEYRDRAIKNIKYILKRGKTPILVGGTGLYISSVIDNLRIPHVPPHTKLRESLEEKSGEELFSLLSQLDPKTAEKIDRHNKRRVIRALEVCIFTGESFSSQQEKGEPLFDVLQIGVDVPREVLYTRINDRVDEMMERGLLDEVLSLVRQKYSWDIPSMSGIGYRQFQSYLRNEKSLPETVEAFKQDTRHYARRQLTWFRRDKRIVWCSSFDEAEVEVAQFLGA